MNNTIPHDKHLYNELSDNDLIAAVLRGETQAFATIVRRYERPVAATIIGMLGRSNEVEEIGQHVFVKFYDALPTFRGDAAVKTYLTRIAINLSLNELKRRKRRFSLFRPIEDAVEVPTDHANTHAENMLDRELIEYALRRLPTGMREVAVLRLVNGYSTEETAIMLNIPEGTVLSRLCLAKKKLQRLLKPHFGDDYAS